jgi:hypothetical protein
MVAEVRDECTMPLQDVVLVAQLAIAVSLLVLGLSQAPDWGWGSHVYGSLAAR